MRSSAYHIKVSVQDQLLYSKTQPTSSSFEGPTRPSQVSLECQKLAYAPQCFRRQLRYLGKVWVH